MSAPTTNDVWAQIRALGYELTPAQIQNTNALMAPLAPKPGADVTVHRDVSYGSDPRHRLDVFVPSAGAAHAPVLVFVHGGGFIMGDKGAPDAPFYNNVGLWAARSGCIGVTITYRLAPAAQWPAGSEDTGAAVRLLRSNVERWGGDPSRIFLMGQSAGAVHVAGYLATASRGDIAGAIMVSGIYDVVRATPNPFHAAYYGEEASGFAAQSTLGKLAETSIPCMYTVSEFDPPDFQRQAAWIVQAHAERQGTWPRVIQLSGHNHLSSVLQIGSAIDTLGPELLRFMAGPSPVPQQA